MFRGVHGRLITNQDGVCEPKVSGYECGGGSADRRHIRFRWI
jgi:hypothetical protein